MTPGPSTVRDIKHLGAFYTPETIATSLAQWAIRTGKERILEPSVGGGSLLRAALKQADLVSGQVTGKVALACDVNPDAISLLRNDLDSIVDFAQGDFLSLDPKLFAKFDVVIANPPFTRNHAIEPSRRSDLRAQFKISGAAGLWVHFLLHATQFLNKGGRIASVAPASMLFTDYGKALLNRLCSEFADVRVFELNERPAWVGRAEERGSIVLASGFQDGSCTTWMRGRWDSAGPTVNVESQASTVAVFNELLDASVSLSKLAKLSIGAVTGRNSVFLLTEAERRAAGIDLKDVRLVVSRARHIKGLSVTTSDLARLGRNGERTWLLLPRKLEGACATHLSKISDQERASIVWLNKRRPWWRVDPGADCDAVFTYMNHLGPRLAIAGPDIVCTNTLHKLVFTEAAPPQVRVAAAATFASSFGQLAGESLGRVYGGGVLKFELGEARQMPVFAQATLDDAVFRRADIAHRQGAGDAALDLVDKALLEPILGASWKKGVADLRLALRQRRETRDKSALRCEPK